MKLVTARSFSDFMDGFKSPSSKRWDGIGYPTLTLSTAFLLHEGDCPFSWIKHGKEPDSEPVNFLLFWYFSVFLRLFMILSAKIPLLCVYFPHNLIINV